MPPPRKKIAKCNDDKPFFDNKGLLAELQAVANIENRNKNRSRAKVVNSAVISIPPITSSWTTDGSDMNFFRNSENSNDFCPKRCRSFFKHYASDADSETIGPDGIEKLCNDLGVRPDDIVILALSWKLRANLMGEYTLEEWLHGMTELKCDSINKLRNKMNIIRGYLTDKFLFKAIYRYSFDFAREKDQKFLERETAIQLLGILLADRWRTFGLFAEFLRESKYKVINKDQYNNILDFSRSVSDDMSNYDENSAWPVMMDEFVDWCRTFKGMPVSTVGDTHTDDIDHGYDGD